MYAQSSVQKQKHLIKLTLWHTFINVSRKDFILKEDNTILVIINLEIKADKNYIFKTTRIEKRKIIQKKMKL